MEEQKYRDKIKPLEYPLHIPPHSEMLVRLDFYLQCLEHRNILTFGTDVEKAMEMIPRCFGMRVDEQHTRSIPYMLDVKVGSQYFSYHFTEPILFAGKTVHLPAWNTEGVEPSEGLIKKLVEIIIERHK